MSEFCPLCFSKGRKSVLKCFQINLTEAARMCVDAKCPYPFGLKYCDTFVNQNFMAMFMDDDVLDTVSHSESVPFFSSDEMNVIKTEPVKDANLPSTAQSLPNKENVKNYDLMDKLDFDVFSSTNMKDVDFSFDPEFESLFESIIEDTVGDSQKVLSAGNDFEELNTGLSADTGFEKLSTDSFDAQTGGKEANSVMSKVQPNLLFAETDKNKDNSLVMTESYQSGFTDICFERKETSSYSGDTQQNITVAHKYEIIPISNQSQELALTSDYDESKHGDHTAARQSLLNRLSSPATVTLQTLDISQHEVDLESVHSNDLAVHNKLQTGDGQLMNSLQSVTESKIRVGESFNLNSANSSSPEKSIQFLNHTQISHSMTSGDNIATGNMSDVMTAEVGILGMTPCSLREIRDHSYCKVKDDDSVSISPEKFDLIICDKTSYSVNIVDNIVTGKSMGDMSAEDSIPVLTPCPLTEVQGHSYSKIKDEETLNDQSNVETSHLVTTENSIPVMTDIHDMTYTFPVTNVGDLTVEIVNMVLHDIPVAENITVVSRGMKSVPSGTEVTEAAIKELDLETNTAENMLSAMNNIAGTSRLPSITNTVIEGTVTDVNQTVILGDHVKPDKLAAASYTCIPEVAVKAINIKSNNEPVPQCTDLDVQERQPLTSTVKHIANSGNNVGINCSQHLIVDSNIEQKGSGNRSDLQKNNLFSHSRSRSIERKINNDLKVDGPQYSFATNVKIQGDLTSSGMSNGADVENFIVDDSKKQIVPPQIENIEGNSNLYINKCKENMPFSLRKLGSKEASVTYLKPQVSSLCPPHQQNFSSSQTLSSESSASVAHMGEKCGTAVPIAKQNKSIRKGKNHADSGSGLKSYVFSHSISKEKFAGFTFEKPFVPQANLKTSSKKENSSKAKRTSKGMKTHTGLKKVLSTLAYHPCPDPSTPSTSSTDSSDRVAVLENQCSVADDPMENVSENTSVADHTYVRKESVHEGPDWLQQLLM